MGLADNALRALRERKLEMDLKLTKEDSMLLVFFIWKAENLRLDAFGLKIYQAKDLASAKQVRTIQEWIEKKLIKLKDNDQFEYIAWEGKLKQTYVDRIRDILEHYQSMGFSTTFVKHFVPLLAKLKGEMVAEDSCEE